jgi:hypothetical protein
MDFSSISGAGLAALAAAGAGIRKSPAPAPDAPHSVAAEAPPPPSSDNSPVAAAPKPSVTDVQTHFDAMTKTLVASVVDKETGSVVSEVPPEALRILAQRTAEFRGKIFDAKA